MPLLYFIFPVARRAGLSAVQRGLVTFSFSLESEAAARSLLFWNTLAEVLPLVAAAFTLRSVHTGTEQLDDGVNGAAAAGVGFVRQQFRLRDCDRRISHHRPGDFIRR